MWKLLVVMFVVSSPVAAKSWSDESCYAGLIAQDGGFLFQPAEGDAITCKVKDWPVSQAEAKLACDDGSQATMTVVSDEILIFNGIKMFAFSEANPVCD